MYSHQRHQDKPVVKSLLFSDLNPNRLIYVANGWNHKGGVAAFSLGTINQSQIETKSIVGLTVLLVRETCLTCLRME